MSKKTPAESPWAALTWEDLDEWTGSRRVARGKSYHRSGRVRDLAVSKDGRVLATVIGGDRYATAAWLNVKAKLQKLESQCTCPVGYSACKHAVAVVSAQVSIKASEQSGCLLGIPDSAAY